MKPSPSVLRVLLQEFGGVILFWIMLWQFGLRPAIAATVLFVLVDGTRRLVRHLPVTRVWIFSNALTLLFGAIDLHAVTPFMIRYEGMISNVIIGLVFLVGAYGRKPMIQEIAEERQGAPFEDRPDIRVFFKTFTLVWAGYFFAKAVAYLWIMQSFPLAQALAIRSVVGTGSFVLMLLISSRGRRLYDMSRRWNLLPAL